jgi:hypothetical protein
VLKSKKKMVVEIGVLTTKVNAIERNTSRQKLANHDMQHEIDTLKEEFEKETTKLEKKRSTPRPLSVSLPPSLYSLFLLLSFQSSPSFRPT